MIGKLKIVTKKSLKTIDKFIYNLPTQNKKNFEYLYSNIINNGIPKAINFNYENIKMDTLQYVKSLKVDNKIYKYKFSKSQNQENLYSSIYALLIFDLYDEVKNLSNSEKDEWVSYFDSFQNEKNGLWYDNNLNNEYYDDTDWWGARHLAVHIIAAYNVLGKKPKYKISFIEKYYDLNFLENWLNQVDWSSFIDHSNDIDNKIMNIGAILQYNRDFYKDKKADTALKFLYGFLDEKINLDIAMWGRCNVDNSYELSRTVQFAYHLFMLYFYDEKKLYNKDKIIELTLKTQNILGGFGWELNSSACEDIDSIELLIHLSNENDVQVNHLIKKAFAWILSNQMKDGGFVFKQNSKLLYGHEIMFSGINESNLFATWFRTLSIAKITNYLNIQNNYNINKIPGY